MKNALIKKVSLTMYRYMVTEKVLYHVPVHGSSVKPYVSRPLLQLSVGSHIWVVLIEQNTSLK